MIDGPALVLALTVWIYWFCVGALSVRVRRRTRKLAGIVPSQRLVQWLGLVWVPVVLAWMVLPFLAATRGSGAFALPDPARGAPWFALRAVAAGFGLVCLGFSIQAWRRMGRNWRMAVSPDERTDLVTTGPFARVRHPIYALSIALMLCSVVVAPTLPMLAVAAVHVALMLLKARNEERFLAGVHGAAYADYCRRTGRFVPRWRGRPS
jgi:protein-S-isoprenylcysteine O-methyltransferase Ste14